MDFFTQFISILGLGCNVIAFQQHNKKRFLLWLLGGCALFAIHFFLLGAYTGFLLNGITVFRSIVFARQQQSERYKKVWIFVFLLFYLSTYLITFLVYQVEFSLWNGILELTPVVAMSVVTISLGMTAMKKIRVASLVASLLWLFYNIIHVSIGGVLCEAFCACSIVIGMLRYDRKGE